MFRGGDYVDKEGFFDPKHKNKNANLDVSDINGKRPNATLGNAG